MPCGCPDSDRVPAQDGWIPISPEIGSPVDFDGIVPDYRFESMAMGAAPAPLFLIRNKNLRSFG